jgi:Domain of unknown function (DUF4129)
MRVEQVDPSRAREDAADILGDRRFRSDPAPRPFRGPLEWLGDRLRDLRDVFLDVVRAVPGPTWLAIALLVIALAAAIVVWLVRVHRVRGGIGALASAATGRAARRDDPAALEHEADDAERAGDFERALRLRFRAGLLRLDQRGAIRYRPSLTTGEVRRLLGSDAFDDLAARFEEVAYGRAPAEPADVASARANWPRVLEDASRR